MYDKAIKHLKCTEENGVIASGPGGGRGTGQVLGVTDLHSSPQLPSQPVLPTTGADAPVPMALEFKMWYGFHTTGPLHSYQSHASPYTC